MKSPYILQRIGQRGIGLLAVCVSLVLSAWLIWLDGIINNDGILYVHSAEAFAAGDLTLATNIYRWPFYSWLVALLHQSSGLGVENAAHVLVALLFGMLVYCFISVVAIFDSRRNTLWCAAILILLWPSLSGYRSEIFRDVGYWAFYLAALFCFLRFYARPGLGLAIGWGLAIAIGTLFRIEGLILMIAMPLVLLSDGRAVWAERWRNFFLAQAVLLLCVAAAAVYWLLGSGEIGFTGRLAEPLDWIQRLVYSATTGLDLKAQTLENGLLNEYSKEYGFAAVIATLVVIVIGDTLWNFGVLHLLLAYPWVVADFRKSLPHKRVLLWAIALHFFVIVVFVLDHFFLVGRYILPLSLTVILLAPLGLARLYEDWVVQRRAQTRWSKNWLFPLACVALVFALAGSLYSFGPSKHHLKEGGQWLANHAPGAKILTNNNIAAYYAGLPKSDKLDFDAIINSSDALLKYDYVGIAISSKRTDEAARLSARFTQQPVARFSNRQGDRFLIFRGDKSNSAPQ